MDRGAVGNGGGSRVLRVGTALAGLEPGVGAARRTEASTGGAQ